MKLIEIVDLILIRVENTRNEVAKGLRVYICVKICSLLVRIKHFAYRKPIKPFDTKGGYSDSLYPEEKIIVERSVISSCSTDANFR